jgi:hypothetical protein
MTERKMNFILVLVCVLLALYFLKRVYDAYMRECPQCAAEVIIERPAPPKPPSPPPKELEVCDDE